ncbi:MAG: glycosyltransferase [Giesbergeria sp.]|jgi:glycosyltransferase involved in cell wall biosynthesis|nr:glycosyltransferase [Giesbergeria sp.]
MTPSPVPHLLSVIAPCRNEVAFIDAFCDSVLRQQLPDGWRMEVLIADGLSDDGTRERLQERCARDARLLLVDNPGRIVSTGLNACIARAQGEVIARLDIHTQFAPDYLARCIDTLERSGADNVGGPWVAQGTGAMGEAIAAAFQCRWVVGGARSRDQVYEGEVDTVYLGCWRHDAFARFGLFDETLVRNQDDEYNLRLRRGGGRIWQSGVIRSVYHPRNSLRHLYAQQQQYGYWRPFVVRKHGQPGSLRQLVPALFVAALALSALLLPWAHWPAIALLALYGLYLLLASMVAAHAAGAWRLFWRLPVVIAAFHIGYGWGTWQGLWDVLHARAPASRFARVTR